MKGKVTEFTRVKRLTVQGWSSQLVGYMVLDKSSRSGGGISDKRDVLSIAGMIPVHVQSNEAGRVAIDSLRKANACDTFNYYYQTSKQSYYCVSRNQSAKSESRRPIMQRCIQAHGIDRITDRLGVAACKRSDSLSSKRGLFRRWLDSEG
jgi:hypothetical protein